MRYWSGVEGRGPPDDTCALLSLRLARRVLVFRVLGTREVLPGSAMAIAAMLQSGMAARARAVQGALRLRAAGASAKGGAAAKTKKVRTDGEFLQFCRFFNFQFRRVSGFAMPVCVLSLSLSLSLSLNESYGWCFGVCGSPGRSSCRQGIAREGGSRCQHPEGRARSANSR
jgi:hypothetical protein